MIFVITGRVAREAICRKVMSAPEGHVVRITEANRSLMQNSKLWPMLTDVSDQVEWYGTKLTEWEWKDVFSAALKKSKVVPGLDGGFVVLGQRTSTMTKGEFSDLIVLISAFGDEHGVKWSEPVEVAA